MARLETVLAEAVVSRPPAVLRKATNETDRARLSALADARRGCAADYAAWSDHIRTYAADLEAFYHYRDIALVRAASDRPHVAPTLLEGAVRALSSPQLAPVEQADLLCALVWPADKPSQPAPVPRGAWPSLEALAAELAEAARIVDQQALVAVPQEARDGLAFILPWLCASQGPFRNEPKNGAAFSLAMHFNPADELTFGEAQTASGRPVPEALRSVTAVNRLLHALAGEPVLGPGVCLKEPEEAAADGAQPCGAVDFEALRTALAHAAGSLIPARLDALARVCAGAEATLAWPGVTGGLVAALPTPYGPVLIGGSGSNVWQEVEALAILDLGGDDVFVWNRPEADLAKRPLRVLVDFGGNDIYRVTGVGGPGAGVLGISILIDRGGDDAYLLGVDPAFDPQGGREALLAADPDGSNVPLVPVARVFAPSEEVGATGVALDSGFAFGAGFLGIGLCHDEAGDDLYLGQKFAFGSALWRGVGLLRDDAGDDLAVAAIAACGVGVNGAVGMLDDRGGNDHYQCGGVYESGYSTGSEWDNGHTGAGLGFGSSWRAERRSDAARLQPTFGGGVGILRDAAGDDVYIGGGFSMAASYAGGVGMLVDDAGDDTYFVRRGPGGGNHSGWSGNHALGNGCHRGVGFLLDRGGNDRYSASSLGGGTAWDMAAGFLIDLGGDDALTDLYKPGAVGGNTGWAAARAFAVSYHVGGSDRYDRSSFGDAYSLAPGYPGKGGNFSFFIDAGPEPDAYPRAAMPNDVWRLGKIAWETVEDGALDPQGIGVFVDGL